MGGGSAGRRALGPREADSGKAVGPWSQREGGGGGFGARDVGGRRVLQESRSQCWRGAMEG